MDEKGTAERAKRGLNKADTGYQMRQARAFVMTLRTYGRTDGRTDLLHERHKNTPWQFLIEMHGRI